MTASLEENKIQGLPNRRERELSRLEGVLNRAQEVLGDSPKTYEVRSILSNIKVRKRNPFPYELATLKDFFGMQIDADALPDSSSNSPTRTAPGVSDLRLQNVERLRKEMEDWPEPVPSMEAPLEITFKLQVRTYATPDGANNIVLGMQKRLTK